MANVEKNPRAGLESLPGDIHLTPSQYLKLSLFAQLKKPPTLEKFPGALVVRHFRPDPGKPEKKVELFRQGEPGWTAYYILTLDDVLALRQAQLDAARTDKDRTALLLEINHLQAEQERRRRNQVPEDDPSRKVATVYMATQSARWSGKAGVRRMLNFKSRPSGPIHNYEGNTVFIPVGGPQTISWEAGKAPLFEGELFGELSCLYRTPRSATVVADRECYMVEFLRHILDKVYKDPAYKARADAVYRKRALELHVRNMPLFCDLKKEEFDELQKDVELANFEGGDIVCDEHERSDCMYLVRSGLVRVMKNVSHLLGTADIVNWVGFCEALCAGAASPATPPGRFWALLSERARAVLQGAADLARLGPADRSEIVASVNDVLRSSALPESLFGVKDVLAEIKAPATTAANADLKKIMGGESIQARLRSFPEKRKEWSDGQVRELNRLLLETLDPAGVRQYDRHAGVETILSYCSPGDYFGEMGLMLNQPRSATCVAYSHPNYEGEIQLVKIPSKTFWRLMKMSPAIRDRVKAQIADRRKVTLTTLTKRVWEEANQVQFSEEFGKLGLIQGQQLMLIDLDRCTRCDECVKACVAGHGGTQTRLYLDGPRFGKYLIPTTCRACLDPVCMINCPVASIHRGDNREIVIEEWCIGCEAFADSCPYGSIRMHDLGIVAAEEARGWRFLPAPAPAAQGEWYKPGFRDDNWLVGVGPFRWERDFQEAIQVHTPPLAQAPLPGTAPAAIAFRFAFELGRRLLRPESRFRIEVQSLGAVQHVWLNGQELTLDEKPRKGRHEYSVPPLPSKPEKAPAALKGEPPAPPAPPRPATDFLRAGRNVVAAQVVPSLKLGELLFQLRLDEIKKPMERPEEVEAKLDVNVAEEASEKLVTLRAVVCDLCSQLPSQIPACVHACPHDAALRVDARSQFPTR